MRPDIRRFAGTLLLLVDLLGTLLFALEGGMAAIAANLDLLGIFVLAFCTAVGGGILRDLLIGDVPPSSIRDWRYPAIAVVGALVAFALHSAVSGVPAILLVVLDAAGLGLFAVAGAEKAVAFRLHPFPAVLMGGITGVGGGTLRDLLLTRVPAILQTDVYAVAALAGAAVMILGLRLKLSNSLSAAIGGTTCFALRLASYLLHWNLPRAPL